MEKTLKKHFIPSYVKDTYKNIEDFGPISDRIQQKFLTYLVNTK